MKQSLTIVCLFLCLQLSAQVFLDGYTYEWTSENTIIDDDNDGGSGVEILELEVRDDIEKVYFRIKLDTEINLTEDNNLVLFLDLDNDMSTGPLIGNLGVDFSWDFGENEGYHFTGPNNNVDWSDINFRVLPTHTAKEFEISIDKNAAEGPNLFTHDDISILLQDGIGLDQIPNSPSTFIYTLTNSTHLDYTVDLDKSADEHVRLLSWNTEFDGPLDPGRRQEFIEIITSMDPEIIALQETWDMTTDEAMTFAEELGYMNWHVDKNEDNNIILSKFPIVESHNILQDSRLQAVKINLPDPQYLRDLVVINVHLSCCGADANRQLQVDAIAHFIQELKAGSSAFPVAGNTPFIICGDMNFVGEGQQLQTLLTGDIINESLFDAEGPMDWNNEDLENLLCYQTDARTAVTWRNDFSSFLPGKLDYFIYSSSAMDIPKSFVIQTEIMPDDRLGLYGWDVTSTSIASDHFPMIADLDLPYSPVGIESFSDSDIIVPNPFQDVFSIHSEDLSFTNYKIFDLDGRIVKSGILYSQSDKVDASELNSGIYLIHINNVIYRIVKLD